MIERIVYSLRVSINGTTVVKVCNSEQIAARCLKEMAEENGSVGIWSIEKCSIIEHGDAYPIVTKSMLSYTHFKEIFTHKPLNYKFALQHKKSGKLVYFWSELDMTDYSYTAFVLIMELLSDDNNFIIRPISKKDKNSLKPFDVNMIIDYIDRGLLVPVSINESGPDALNLYLSGSEDFFDKLIYLKDIEKYG